MDHLTPHRRKLTGIIVSDAMQKTRVIAVTSIVVHHRYGKRYQVTKRLKAHDEQNATHVGDRVVIEETRPLSKEKRWRILEKISGGQQS